eukprot:gene17813-biopygen28209
MQRSWVIWYYAPHSGRPVDERIRFWQALEQCVTSVPKHDVLTLLGDSNASVGEARAEGVTGMHGVGKCNNAGVELLDWCSNLDLRIMNGFFRKGRDVPQTWRPPASPPGPWEHGLTIDHCITRSRDAAAVTDVDVREPPEYNSDHRMLVVAVTPLRGQGAWQRKMQRRNCIERFNVNALRDSGTRREFAHSIRAMLEANPISDDIDSEWAHIVDALQIAGDDVLGQCKPTMSTWQEEFASRLHEMAQERRGLVVKYADDDAGFRIAMRLLRAEHQRETRNFVRGWWKRTLHGMSGPKGGPNISTINRLEKAIAPRSNQSSRTELLSADQKVVHRTPTAKQERWREHFKSLFANENNIDLSYVYARTPQRNVLYYLDAEPCDAEVFQAIRELKKKNAAGEDRIVAEMLQMGGTFLHERMSRFVKLVWKHGAVPKAW